jgi:PAS domain-containing protein
MKSRLVDLFTDLAGKASLFGEPVLGHLCRLAAIEAETATMPWSPAIQPSIACIWDWDVPNDLNRVDPSGAELLGVSVTGATKGLPNERYLASVHPDDVEAVSAAVGAAMKHGVFEARYRIIASGQPRWFLGKGFCTIDKSNRPERFAGALIALD